ncbi:hypothetical protein BKA93DRAFT_856425 [Sparassis latifolia]
MPRAPRNASSAVRVNPTASTDRCGRGKAGSECDICGIVVSRAADMPRHKLVHNPDSEAMKFPCPFPGCTYRTLQAGNLKPHSQKHTHKTTPLVCDHVVFSNESFEMCPFQTGDQNELTEHRRSAHGCRAKCAKDNAGKEFIYQLEFDFGFDDDVENVGFEYNFDGAASKPEDVEPQAEDDVDAKIKAKVAAARSTKAQSKAKKQGRAASPMPLATAKNTKKAAAAPVYFIKDDPDLYRSYLASSSIAPSSIPAYPFAASAPSKSEQYTHTPMSSTLQDYESSAVSSNNQQPVIPLPVIEPFIQHHYLPQAPVAEQLIQQQYMPVPPADPYYCIEASIPASAPIPMPQVFLPEDALCGGHFASSLNPVVQPETYGPWASFSTESGNSDVSASNGFDAGLAGMSYSSGSNIAAMTYASGSNAAATNYDGGGDCASTSYASGDANGYANIPYNGGSQYTPDNSDTAFLANLDNYTRNGFDNYTPANANDDTPANFHDDTLAHFNDTLVHFNDTLAHFNDTRAHFNDTLAHFSNDNSAWVNDSGYSSTAWTSDGSFSSTDLSFDSLSTLPQPPVTSDVMLDNDSYSMYEGLLGDHPDGALNGYAQQNAIPMFDVHPAPIYPDGVELGRDSPVRSPVNSGSYLDHMLSFPYASPTMGAIAPPLTPPAATPSQFMAMLASPLPEWGCSQSELFGVFGL